MAHPPQRRRIVRRSKRPRPHGTGFQPPARRQPAPPPVPENQFEPDPDARYVICPASGMLHDAVAVKVTREGPKGCPTHRCPVCGSRGFLPKKTFRPGMGLTAKMAETYNCLILEF